MAVKIRLKKMGRKHRPFFRVCAMDARVPRGGRVIEELGTYDPMIRETDARAILKGERIDYWLGVGAKPTPKVAVLIRKYGAEGSHLEQQQSALEKLAGRVESLKSAATAEAEKAAANRPKPEEKTAEEPAAEATAAEATTDAENSESGGAEPAAGADEAKAESSTADDSAASDS